MHTIDAMRIGAAVQCSESRVSISPSACDGISLGNSRNTYTLRTYLPFSLEISVTPMSDSASVPVAIIGFIFSGFPNPHRGNTTNAHNTKEKPRKANTRGWRIQTPYWSSAPIISPNIQVTYMISDRTSDTD
jgi:hypothetical protein